MKVLVTGATGFVGQALTRKLVARGEDVRVFVRSLDKLASLGLGVDDVVQGDVTDPQAIARAVQGVDLVYAIAGTLREPGLSDARCRAVNVEAVRILFDAASAHGVRRIVHCGTCGIHGSISGPPADESYPIRPVGIYEETKAAGERLAFELSKTDGVEVAALRPGPIYGPGDLRLLKLFKLADRNLIVLIGPGTASYHLVYIDDVTDAFLLAGTEPQAAGEAFLIGGPEIPSLNDIVDELAAMRGRKHSKVVRLPGKPIWLMSRVCESTCRTLGISPPIYPRRVEFFLNNRAYDIGKARKVLGFTPKVAMRDGLHRTAEWYQRMGLL